MLLQYNCCLLKRMKCYSSSFIKVSYLKPVTPRKCFVLIAIIITKKSECQIANKIHICNISHLAICVFALCNMELKFTFYVTRCTQGVPVFFSDLIRAAEK